MEFARGSMQRTVGAAFAIIIMPLLIHHVPTAIVLSIDAPCPDLRLVRLHLSGVHIHKDAPDVTSVMSRSTSSYVHKYLRVQSVLFVGSELPPSISRQDNLKLTTAHGRRNKYAPDLPCIPLIIALTELTYRRISLCMYGL